MLPLFVLLACQRQPDIVSAQAVGASPLAVAVGAHRSVRAVPRLTLRVSQDHVTLQTQALDVALHPVETPPQIIPQPKQSLIDPSDPLVIGNDLFLDLPVSVPSVRHELIDGLRQRWDLPVLHVHDGNIPRIFFRLQDLALPPEGYDIRINRNSALVLGQDAAGLRHAVSTLVQLFYSHDGKLCLPKAMIRDWPSVAWRGVHMFVGPNALEFHQELWNRVLDPLKFNHVVLECERTQWNALPEPKPADYMSRSDLVHLFDFYREINVEPIPLIQSFGHMDWLFSDNQNLDLALYSDPPTSIDPRLPRARQLLSQIWNEAISTLHPRAIHFGLDEVAVKWPAKDPGLMTQLWTMHMAYLSNIASSHNVAMMCWGDQCLGPGEAIDAALAENRDDAKVRREAIPKGAYVTDWHYKNDPNPDRFSSSLHLWKEDGQLPIAASWFRPENIRGFTLAAIQQGAGTLQTTWAGKESDEDGMLREYRQFSAMVVAADYAWSGRQDDCDKLGYDPGEVFGRMFYGVRSPVEAKAGQSACPDVSTSAKIGNVEFKCFAPYALRSLNTPESNQLPLDLVIDTPGLKGSEIALALDTMVSSDDNEAIGSIEIDTSHGPVTRPLLYGDDVRTAGDTRAVYRCARQNGLCALRVSLGQEPVQIKRIVLHGNSTMVGLRLHGISAF